ncbi:hypothetical protein HY487_00370 [Candidatus Woesearchaeota archaeon]|nr:hypothetical protein [Candidatus Woesearchaeota archaeon]
MAYYIPQLGWLRYPKNFYAERNQVLLVNGNGQPIQAQPVQVLATQFIADDGTPLTRVGIVDRANRITTGKEEFDLISLNSSNGFNRQALEEAVRKASFEGQIITWE